MRRKIDRLEYTERDLREQVRDLCGVFGWRIMQIIRTVALALYCHEPCCKASGLILDFPENVVHPWIMARYGQMTYLFGQLFSRRYYRYFCLAQRWPQGQSSRLYYPSSWHNGSSRRGGIYQGLLYTVLSVLHAVSLYCEHGKHAVEPCVVASLDIFATKKDELCTISAVLLLPYQDGVHDTASHFPIAFEGLL